MKKWSFFLIACVLSLYYTGATLGAVGFMSTAGFESDLEWRGLDSSWTETSEGFVDGPEQTVEDIAISDQRMDGTRDFTYTVVLEKNAGYGAGLVLGAKDSMDRQSVLQNYIFFIADDANVYYRCTTDGVTAGPVGRPLTEEEKQASSWTFQVIYRAAEEDAQFMLNGRVVQSYSSAERLAGYLGLIAHDASVVVKSATVVLGDMPGEEEGEPLFETNLTGWQGMNSTWEVTPTGYRDGVEQGIWDCSTSDIMVDGTRSFTYEVIVERMSGYGMGLLFGVANRESRDSVLQDYSYFIVDPDNVYCAFDAGNNLGRPLETSERCPRATDPNGTPREYTLAMEYNANSGLVVFTLDGEIIWTAYDQDVSGYLGLLAHDSRMFVKRAVLQFEDESTPEPTKTPSATAIPSTTPTPAATNPPTQDNGGFPVLLVLLSVVIAGVLIVWFLRRKCF